MPQPSTLKVHVSGVLTPEIAISIRATRAGHNLCMTCPFVFARQSPRSREQSFSQLEPSSDCHHKVIDSSGSHTISATFTLLLYKDKTWNQSRQDKQLGGSRQARRKRILIWLMVLNMSRKISWDTRYVSSATPMYRLPLFRRKLDQAYI